LLVDGHRGRQALDEVHVRLVHLTEELPGVGRKRLDVATLPLGEDRVEGEARLAGAGETGENDQAVSGQVEVDPAQIVLPRAADDETVGHWFPFDRVVAATRVADSMLGRGTDNFGEEPGSRPTVTRQAVSVATKVA